MSIMTTITQSNTCGAKSMHTVSYTIMKKRFVKQSNRSGCDSKSININWSHLAIAMESPSWTSLHTRSMERSKYYAAKIYITIQTAASLSAVLQLLIQTNYSNRK